MSSVDTTSLLEEFVLAEDKEKFLSTITTHSEYKNLAINYTLNKDLPLPKDEQYQIVKDNSTYLRLKYLLLQLQKPGLPEKDKKVMMDELNRGWLHYQTNHSRAAAPGGRVFKPPSQAPNRDFMGSSDSDTPAEPPKTAKKGYPASKASKEFLDYGKVDLLIDKLYALKENQSNQAWTLLNAISDKNFRKIDLKRVKEPRAQHRILTSLDDYSGIEHLDKLFADVKANEKRIYKTSSNNLAYSTQNHFNKMSLKQLKSVAKKLEIGDSLDINLRIFELEFYETYSELENTTDEDQIFEILKKFKKLVDKKNSVLGGSGGFLNKVGKLVSGAWDPNLGAVSRLLNKCILINTLKRGKIDEEAFVRFLERPVDSASFYGLLEKHSKKYHRNFEFVSTSWKKFVFGYERAYTDRKLVDDCLEALLTTEEALKKYRAYFSEEILEKILQRNLIKNGASLDRYRALVGDRKADELVNLKYLRLIPQNLSDFTNEEKIVLTLKIKNIAKLEIREYQFDSLRYLKENGGALPGPEIDLDGLVPETSRTVTYELPKQQEHLETFQFPELSEKKRGYFIIDFLGDKLMSRAVIKRGALSLLHKPFEHGYEFFILDESKNVCAKPGTGIFIDNKFLEIDPKTGSIRIPFAKQALNKQVILVHDGFAFADRVYVPAEQYSMKNAVIFNDEGLVAGRRARFIIRTALELNGRPMSVRKLKNSKISLELLSEDGLQNSKNYPDLELRDDRDVTFDFLVPNKISKIKFLMVGEVETVASGKLDLSYSETIYVQRNFGRQTFKSLFVSQDEKGNYFVEAKGRNGEALEDQSINVSLVRRSDGASRSFNLRTDNLGKAYLGELSGIDSISVSGSNFDYKQLKIKISRIGDDFKLPDTFNICKGEELVLPRLGAALNQQNLRLWKLTQDGGLFLQDRFEAIQEDPKNQTNLVLAGLEPGSYQLTYFLEFLTKKVEIFVSDSKRWKFSPMFIEGSNTLEYVSGELSYLNIQSVGLDGEKNLKKIDPKKITKSTELEVRVTSNDLENAVLHVLGYHNAPLHTDFMTQKLKTAVSQPVNVTHKMNTTTNQYVSERVLGDEMTYVLNRNSEKPPIGNTLEKPSIHLHRKFIRETSEDDEVLNEGRSFDSSLATTGLAITTVSSRKRSWDKKKKKKLSRTMDKSSRFYHDELRGGGSGAFETGFGNILNDFDYVKNSGETVANVKVGEDGVFRLPLGDLAGYSKLVLFVSDRFGQASRHISLQAPKIDKIDQRLEESKPAGVIYTEERYTVGDDASGEAGARILVKDSKTTNTLILENLGDLADCYGTISGAGNKDVTQKFDFLANWANLTENQKLKKLETFGGHELNTFCYLRDSEFFEHRIKPILRYKSEKELIDHILTEEVSEVRKHLSVLKLSKLSGIELILLANLLKNEKRAVIEKIVRALKMRLEPSKKAYQAQLTALYDSLLASKDLKDQMDLMMQQNQQTIMANGKLMLKRDYDVLRMDESRKSQLRSRSIVQEVEEVYFSPADARLERLEEVEDACMDMAFECDDDDDFGDIDLEPEMLSNIRSGLAAGGGPGVTEVNQKVTIKRYNKAGATFEFQERHSYFPATPPKGEFNRFHLAVLEAILATGSPLVLDEAFMLLRDTPYGFVQCLAFVNLPFKKSGDLATKTVGKDLEITASNPLLVINKKIEEKTTEKYPLDLIVNQKFFDPNDKFSYDEANPDLKRLKNVTEFLRGKIYHSEITITNLAENDVSVKLITQIPEGSIPVGDLEPLKIQTHPAYALKTLVTQFSFYFPEPGKFACYPATLMKNNQFVASAKLSHPLTVVKAFKRSKKDFESLEDILNYGTEDDIIEYLEAKNIHDSRVFTPRQIYWMLKSEKYYKKILGIFKKKCLFDSTTWGYCFKHHDLDTFEELMINTEKLKNQLRGSRYFSTKYVTIDEFTPLEYDPLINPRAHNLSEKRQNIRNREFKATYEKFLRYCAAKIDLGSREKVILAAYLALQDRVKDSWPVLEKVDVAELRGDEVMVVQYDYLRAYLSIYREYPGFETAREVAGRYQQFQDLGWRKRFRQIQKQLDEFDGLVSGVSGAAEDLEDGQKIQHVENLVAGGKAEYLKVELDSNKTQSQDCSIVVTHSNITQLAVKYYILEPEVLFTRDPFLSENIKKFAFIDPNRLDLIDLGVAGDAEFRKKVIRVPDELQASCLFISVQSDDKTSGLKVFNSKFTVNVIEDFGVVKVRGKAVEGAGKKARLLSKVYVKCYYREKGSGAVKFYKDGYTDFRGSFDYASLNSDSLSKVERFSILVLSEEFGAEVVEAKPPSLVGQVVRA